MYKIGDRFKVISSGYEIEITGVTTGDIYHCMVYRNGEMYRTTNITGTEFDNQLINDIFVKIG